MSTYTCTEHGETVVVYQGGGYQPPCPLCEAEGKVEDLTEELEDVRGERDSYKDEVDSIQSAAEDV